MVTQKGFLLVPCYNEEIRFNISYFSFIKREIENYTKNLDFQVELMFIDDGSRDGTKNLLALACKQMPATILSLEHNIGKGNALRLAMLSVMPKRPKFVAYLDADGAFDKTDVVNSILTYINSYLIAEIDVLSFARISMAGTMIRRNKIRHLIGRVIATIVNLNSQYTFYDSQTGFKIYSGNFLRDIDLEETLKTKWFFDWEIILRASSKVKIHELPIPNWRDVHGSKLSIGSALSVLREIIKIKLLQKRKKWT